LNWLQKPPQSALNIGVRWVSVGFSDLGEWGFMLKSLVVIAALAIAAPGLAIADDNQNNNSGPQNSNGLPFTANDPPAADFNSKGRPAGFPFVPGCNVLAMDKDDHNNGPNGDDKNPVHGNPHCRPASP
jgi:hypothetical protein